MVGKEEYTKGRIAGGWVHISRGKMPIALVHPKYVDKFLAVPDLYEALVGLLEAYDVNLPAEECDYPDYWIKALQARAKAEGK